MSSLVKDWDNVINLIELSSLNSDIAQCELSDEIMYLQEMQGHLAKAKELILEVREHYYYVK